MSVFSKKILLAALSTALAGSAQTATASSSASAHIDWDSLTIQYFDLSLGSNAPNINWTYEYGEAYSNAYNQDPYEYQDDYQYAYDFSSAISTNTSTLYAQSSSLRDGNDLDAYAATQPSTTPSFGYSFNNAQSYAHNSGNFEMTGKGLALITLDWSASGNGTLNDWTDYAHSSIYIAGNFSDGNGNNGSVYSNYYQYTGYDGSYNQSGTFSMAIFSDGIHTVSGSLTAQANSNSSSPVSSVPVPAAAWLFGSGLVGLLGVARRKPIA